MYLVHITAENRFVFTENPNLYKKQFINPYISKNPYICQNLGCTDYPWWFSIEEIMWPKYVYFQPLKDREYYKNFAFKPILENSHFKLEELVLVGNRIIPQTPFKQELLETVAKRMYHPSKIDFDNNI